MNCISWTLLHSSGPMVHQFETSAVHLYNITELHLNALEYDLVFNTRKAFFSQYHLIYDSGHEKIGHNA